MPPSRCCCSLNHTLKSVLKSLPPADAHKIHRLDPQTGDVLGTFESNRFVTGVTWVDGELWHATWENEQSELRHVDAASGEVVESLQMPAGVVISGLESDGADGFFCGGADSGKIRAVHR